MYVAGLELIDGAEALETLHTKLGALLGTDARDRLFEGVERPALGTPNALKPSPMRTVVERMLASLDRERCVQVIGQGLRYLEDEWYADAKAKYEEAGGIDAYLERKAAAFIAELEKHRDEGTLFFNQRITDAVIDHVRSHPEIASGVREGTTVYEAKIPHQAIEYLQASDPAARAYHYCHCPWVKSSLREAGPKTPAVFCHCSAAFHKKPYEVIFGRPLQAEVVESVLSGDPWCRFAIHLPEDAT
jgi:hypothetical protein